jgi:hypothetical protein
VNATGNEYLSTLFLMLLPRVTAVWLSVYCNSKSRGRVGDGLPLCYKRMTLDPHGCLRGAAAVIVSGFPLKSTTGIEVQSRGEAPSKSCKFSPKERSPVFYNDGSDATNPGPFEWGVKRLAASFVVAEGPNEFNSLNFWLDKGDSARMVFQLKKHDIKAETYPGTITLRSRGVNQRQPTGVKLQS